jgi:hypothetical protein
MMILSPGAIFCASGFLPFKKTPMPAVLIKMPSAAPPSTTFVSPVTTETPASLAVAAMEATRRLNVSIANPASMIMPTDIYLGQAPLTARSFTVPLTHSLPRSPPGKNSGFTTKLSVVMAMTLLPLQIAASVRGSSISFPYAGKKSSCTSSL